MPVMLNLDEINTADVLNDLHNCMNPEPIPGNMNIEHPVMHLVETAENPAAPQPLTFAGFGNHSRGKPISMLAKTIVQKQKDVDMNSDDDDDFRTVPLTPQPTKRQNKSPMEDPRLAKKAKAPSPPKKKTQVVVNRKVLPKPAPPKPAPTNQDGERACSSAQAKAADQAAAAAAAGSAGVPKVAQTTLCQFGNMQNVFKGNTACADVCKTPIAQEAEVPAPDAPRQPPRQRLTTRRRNQQPNRLRCNIPFQPDLEYVHVKYPGYGRAVMLREVRGGNTICLSFDMMREISRQMRRN